MRLIRSIVAAGLLAVVAQPALACIPVQEVPPKPPVSAHERQEQMWREADSVVLVRITAFNRLDPRLSALSARERREQIEADPTIIGVTLEPLRWLKGQGQPTLFRVRHRGGGDCSVATGWDRSAKVGDIFVAYFTAGPLSDATLIDGLAPEVIVEATVKALLTSSQ